MARLALGCLRSVRIGLMVGLALVAGTAARAADPIVLRFADDIPKTHPISVYASKFWMDTVERLTHGQVTFQWYPSGQLGKGRDVLALVQSGAAVLVDVVSGRPSQSQIQVALDAVAAKSIAVMPGPHVGLGEASNDRLQRAAAPR